MGTGNHRHQNLHPIEFSGPAVADGRGVGLKRSLAGGGSGAVHGDALHTGMILLQPLIAVFERNEVGIDLLQSLAALPHQRQPDVQADSSQSGQNLMPAADPSITVLNGTADTLHRKPAGSYQPFDRQITGHPDGQIRAEKL